MFSNSRGWIFLSLVSLVFMIIGQLMFGRQGLLLGFFVASALNVYIYFISEKIIFNFYKAEPLKGQDPWGAGSALQKVSQQFRAPPAQIFITRMDCPILFCSHRGWGKNKIILSDSLLDKLTPLEIQDLLTIHMFYLLGSHSLFVGFRSQFTETIFIISRALDIFISLPRLIVGKKPFVFFQKLFLPLGTLFMKSFKKSLLSTDEQAAKVIGSNERMAKLLWKLDSLFTTKPLSTPPSPNILCLVNPLTYEGLDLYFQRHFSIDKRIKNLLGHYPL